jgi:hypothetical protein
MALLGKGILLTFTEVPAEAEEDFNEWYNREHIDERVFMPGFRRARRYRAVQGRPKYFATYETETVAALGAPEYLARLADQSDWSKRVMGGFSFFHRMTCEVTADVSHGIGGALTLVRFFPPDAVKDGLRDWLADEALPAVKARPGLLGASLLENDLDVANAPALQQGGGQFPLVDRQEWAVLVDGAETGPTAAAALDLLGPDTLAERGVDGPVEIATYQFLFGNDRQS